MISVMTPADMLKQLNSHGENAGSGYNDSDEVHGRFGWTVAPIGDTGISVLTITYEDQEYDRPPVERRWILSPIHEVPPIMTLGDEPHETATSTK